MPAEHRGGGTEQDHERDAVGFAANRNGRELREKIQVFYFV
jgi:hypothetical protein